MAVSTPSGKGNVTARKARRDAMSEVLADGWWAVGLRGILGILFGLICLLTPGVAVQVFVILFAAYMLVDGVFAIISGVKAARNGERWGLLILEGIVDLAAGAVAVLWPATAPAARSTMPSRMSRPQRSPLRAALMPEMMANTPSTSI